MRRALVATLLALLAVAGPARALGIITYFIFFDKGSAELPERSEKTMEDFVKVFNTKTGARAILWAHTDSAEAQSEAASLSLSRGEAVKRRLVELGIPSNLIEIRAKGDKSPFVVTGPNVNELQNRRVQLDIE